MVNLKDQDSPAVKIVGGVIIALILIVTFGSIALIDSPIFNTPSGTTLPSIHSVFAAATLMVMIVSVTFIAVVVLNEYILPRFRKRR